MTALAAAGGTAVVQAAGTDAWRELRATVARWFGRQGSQREDTVLEQLDATAAALDATGGGEVEEEMSRHAARWQSRFEELLGSLDGPQQHDAAAELDKLVNGATPSQHWEQHVTSDGNGLAVGAQGPHSSVHIHHHGSMPTREGWHAGE